MIDNCFKNRMSLWWNGVRHLSGHYWDDYPGTLSFSAWRRHQIETFSASLALCAGNSPVTGEFPTQRPVARSCDVFFHLRLNKRLSKQSWGWWFETPSRPLLRQCNGSHWNLFEDRTPVDFIYRYPSFNWVAETWLYDKVPRMAVVGLALFGAWRYV